MYLRDICHCIYNLSTLHNFNNYILCSYVISQIFRRNCKTFVFVHRIYAIWKITFVPTNSNIGTRLHFFSSRSIGYNTLTDIPIHTRDIYDTYLCWISAILKINDSLSQIIFRIRAQYHVECYLARFKLVPSVRFNPVW